MKEFVIFIILYLSIMVNSTSSPEPTDFRKPARQSGSPIPMNSLTSNQDNSNKASYSASGISIQQSSPQFVRQTIPPEYTASTQPHSSVYTHLQSGNQPSTPQGGYIISVNSQGGTTGVAPGPTPVLMQYLPHTQSTSAGVQYLQLIPTRPLIVPISPYITQIPYSGNNIGLHSNSIQSNQGTSGTSSQLQHQTSSYQQNPTGGYSSPVISYFRPYSGMQLVNGPVDLSLNTNEYLPIQGDSSYKLRRT